MSRRIVLVDIGAGLSLTGILPSVALFDAYGARLIARGGNPPYTFAIVAGALPDGLALDTATGIISGIANAPGSFGFTARVSDITGATVARSFVIEVQAEPLSLSGAAPAWTVGTPYSYTYTAVNGVPPYTWSLATGSLPAGLVLDAATGTIGGTPTAPNAPAWTVRVTDSAGVVVDLRDNGTLQLLGDFDAATVGDAYSSDIMINGGDAPYLNPRVTTGSLPSWATLSIVGGALRLSGTPTGSATTIAITVSVDSDDGQSAASAQDIVVSVTSWATWDPGIKASDIVLSADLLTASTTVKGQPHGVRSTVPLTGKRYFEINQMMSGNIGGNCGSGVADGSVSMTAFDGTQVGTASFWTSNSGVYINGVKTIISNITGQIAIAIDVSTRRVWIKEVGAASWVGGGNPATNTSPTGTLSLTGAIYAATCPWTYSTSRPVSIKLISDPAQMAGPVPAGFTAGF